MGLVMIKYQFSEQNLEDEVNMIREGNTVKRLHLQKSVLKKVK